MAYSEALPMREDTPEPPPLITVDVENDVRAKLNATWREKSGLWGWLTSTNHKSIAKRYVITALIFFALGGLEAGMIRMPLSRPGDRFIRADLYKPIFTLPRTTR